MTTTKEVTRWLKRQGYALVDDEWYAHIDLWQQWYSGKVRSVHSYRQFNGKKHVPRERKSLGMAKSIAEDWANLSLNEKVDITIKKKTAEKRINQVLQRNHFRMRANQLVELTFALGTGAFVEYTDGDETKIDYIRAGMIYPLSVDNGKITECAFASERTVKGEKQVYLNMHILEHGRYVVENHLFRRKGSMLTEIDLPEGVEQRVPTGSAVPHFQIIKPNIVNNVDLNCPMGISVYANALDQLESVDLIFDSYCNEFRLGKKRITVPISMTQMQMEEDGTVTPTFDDADVEFYAVPAATSAGVGENKIVEHNMEIRSEAHSTGIQDALNMLSYKCGLGKGRYDFSDGQVRTATEVVSEKSDLFQNLKKHEILLNDALVGMVQAIAELEGLSPDVEVAINFDDSIIEDTGAEKMRFMQEISSGVRQKYEYRMKFFGEDEATAKAMTAEDDADPLGLNNA